MRISRGILNRGMAKLALLALCMTLMATQSAFADTIDGEIAFTGIFTTTGGSGPGDLAGATGIDFGTAFVLQSTGDFASNGVMPLLSPVTMNDFTFDPFTGPVDPLWSVGAFQFSLSSLNTIEQGESYLVLAGSGTVTSSIAGLDATSFDWSFSGDKSGGNLKVFSSTATALPEPSDFATFGFLALGIVAVSVRSRRLSKVFTR